MRKELGKIKSAKFGFNDWEYGIHFDLGGEGWGVFMAWGYSPAYEGHSVTGPTILKRIQNILKDAKVETVDELKGIPVECEFDGNLLKSFRVLTEVL